MEFKKYPKIRHLGHEENEGILQVGDRILVEEKIDGANFRFMVHDGTIIFGSRNKQLTSDEGEETNITKNFRRAVAHIRETLEGKDLSEVEGCILYGENCVKHSLNYDWDKIPPVLMFDIYDTKAEMWYPINTKHSIFDKLGLDTVPIIFNGRWKGTDEEKEVLEIPKSKYAQGNYAEGIMIKNYDKGLFAKIVSDKFKEINRKTFGGGKKHAEDDTEYFSVMYCTNARIDKQIFKLVDEGHALELKMMHKLPHRVYEDIWEEHWKDMAFSKKIIDTNKFKKMVSHRCLHVLKQMMVNNELNKEV